MSSVKVLLHKKKPGQKTYPVAIRIIVKRDPKYIYVGPYVSENDWDDETQRVKDSHPSYKSYNNAILNKLTEADNLLIEVDVKKKDVSARQIKKQLKRNSKTISFSKLAEEYLENILEAQKFDIYRTDKSRIEKIKEFACGELYFQDITVPFLKKFIAYRKGTEENSNRTIMNYLILIRTLFNDAIEEGIVDKENYPFGKKKIQIKLPGSLKVGLNQSEVKKIEKLSYPEGSMIRHVQNVWLFCFYFAGMRIGDALFKRWPEFAGGRVNYIMNKNDKAVSFPIPEKAQKILEYYEKDKQYEEDYIFPDMRKADQDDPEDLARKKKNAIRLFNKYLKRIAKDAKVNKKLSNHISRHSFGECSGEKIPVQTLQILYKHEHLTTTINYQSNFISKNIDKALNSVVNF